MNSYSIPTCNNRPVRTPAQSLNRRKHLRSPHLLLGILCVFVLMLTFSACDQYGFFDDGIHSGTGTIYDLYGYDKDGYNADGFNADGKHRDTNTIYNPQGYDEQGYDKNGFNADGNYRDGTKYNRDGYDKDGYNAAGFNTEGDHRDTGTKYGDDGYDEQGYDANGFNAKGYDINGYDINGFDADGNHRVTGDIYDRDGYRQNGYDANGYNRDGYNALGDHRDDFLTLAAANERITDIWSNGTTMWVLDSLADHIYAYTMETKERDEPKEFTAATLTAAGNTNPLGIWSDGTTMWVINSTNKIYAYTMETKARDTNKEFTATGGISNPFGLWSNGTTMWVVDVLKNTYAYDYTIDTAGAITATYNMSKDFDPAILTAAGNNDPRSIWSNGITMYMSDAQDNKIYAYDYTIDNAGSITVTYNASKDFNNILSTMGNTSAFGIYSNETTMWVGNNSNRKIFAYNLATRARPPKTETE